jgi:hypothetical protein
MDSRIQKLRVLVHIRQRSKRREVFSHLREKERPCKNLVKEVYAAAEILIEIAILPDERDTAWCEEEPDRFYEWNIAEQMKAGGLYSPIGQATILELSGRARQS